MYMQNKEREMLAAGLIHRANLLAGVFIVGLSLTEKSMAAYVPVIAEWLPVVCMQ
jgi:hypothetical protein